MIAYPMGPFLSMPIVLKKALMPNPPEMAPAIKTLVECAEIARKEGVMALENKTGDIEDPVVAAAGELDTAVEVGPSASIGVSGVLNPYDSLSANVDVRWDVAGAHEGMVINPGITYFTPVSRGAGISLSLSAEHGDEAFNEYYYSVTPAQATASGLPIYDAGSGFNKLSANLLVGVDLDGDLANGGLALFAIGGYSRMIGDAKDSPFVALRGDADQFLIGGGIGYTF